jgi:hypothetical protein
MSAHDNDWHAEAFARNIWSMAGRLQLFNSPGELATIGQVWFCMFTAPVRRN